MSKSLLFRSHATSAQAYQWRHSRKRCVPTRAFIVVLCEPTYRSFLLYIFHFFRVSALLAKPSYHYLISLSSSSPCNSNQTITGSRVSVKESILLQRGCESACAHSLWCSGSQLPHSNLSHDNTPRVARHRHSGIDLNILLARCRRFVRYDRVICDRTPNCLTPGHLIQFN